MDNTDIINHYMETCTFDISTIQSYQAPRQVDYLNSDGQVGHSVVQAAHHEAAPVELLVVGDGVQLQVLHRLPGMPAIPSSVCGSTDLVRFSGLEY